MLAFKIALSSGVTPSASACSSVGTRFDEQPRHSEIAAPRRVEQRSLRARRGRAHAVLRPTAANDADAFRAGVLARQAKRGARRRRASARSRRRRARAAAARRRHGPRATATMSAVWSYSGSRSSTGAPARAAARQSPPCRRAPPSIKRSLAGGVASVAVGARGEQQIDRRQVARSRSRDAAARRRARSGRFGSAPASSSRPAVARSCDAHDPVQRRRVVRAERVRVGAAARAACARPPDRDSSRRRRASRTRRRRRADQRRGQRRSERGAQAPQRDARRRPCMGESTRGRS